MKKPYARRPIPGIPRWVGYMAFTGSSGKSGPATITVTAKVGHLRLRLWVLWRLLTGQVDTTE